MLAKATYDDVINIPAIGDVIAKAVIDYFREPKNVELIQDLKDLGLNTVYKEVEVVDSFFTGKKVVLTGSLNNIKRDEAKALITKLGGLNVSSVSKKTDIVLAGDKAGSKLEKAISLGIYVMKEEEFLSFINKGDIKIDE